VAGLRHRHAARRRENCFLFCLCFAPDMKSPLIGRTTGAASFERAFVARVDARLYARFVVDKRA
jgi:hypothetical protein